MIARVSVGLSVFAWLAVVDAVPRAAPTVEPMPTIEGPLRRWTRTRVERCRRGDPRGCQEAAYAFRVGGDGVDADPLMAERLYVRAWSLRPRRSEQDLLPIFEMGVAAPDERAYVLAVCERGGGYACATVGLADLRHARSRRAQRAALDLIERGAHCPQVGYFHYSTEFGRDLREEYPWYFRERRAAAGR